MAGFHGITGASEVASSFLEVCLPWFTLTDRSVHGERDKITVVIE